MPYYIIGASLQKLSHCVYCGNEATQRDQVLPISKRAQRPSDFLSFEVPVCRECNLALGARVFNTFGEKAAFARRIIYERGFNPTYTQIIEHAILDQLNPIVEKFLLDRAFAMNIPHRALGNPILGLMLAPRSAFSEQLVPNRRKLFRRKEGEPLWRDELL